MGKSIYSGSRGWGARIRANAPQLTLQEPKDLVKLPITVALTKHSSRRGDAMLEYRLGLNANSVKITGTAMVSFTLPHQDEGDALLCQVELAFRETGQVECDGGVLV